jgi:hypothetical protein
MVRGIFKSIKLSLLNIALILLSLLLVIVVMEVLLRFTHYKSIISRNEEFRYYYKSDPIKGYDIEANIKKFQTNTDNEIYFHIWSNEIGCFDKPYQGEKDYILLIGDSFSHGHVPFANKWGSQIEELLDYRVVRCGVPGYGTKQEFLKTKELIELIGTPPNLMILGYCFNDVEDDYLFPRSAVVDGYLVNLKQLINVATGETTSRKDLEEQFGFLASGSFITIKNFIKRNSIMGNLLISSIKNKYLEAPTHKNLYENIFLSFRDFKWIDNAWEEHFKNIKNIESIATKNNSKLLIIIIPTKEQVYPFLFDWKDAGIDPERPNKKIINYLNKEGVNYIDLLPLFKEFANQQPRQFLAPGDDFYWRYDGHWSVKGEHLVALLVAKSILENDMIAIRGKAEKLKIIDNELQEFREKNH